MRLRRRYGAGRLNGEFVHKHEHSIEFAVLALQFFHRENPNFKILPILCGSLHEDLGADAGPPTQRPDIGEFIESLRGLIAEHDGRVCVVGKRRFEPRRAQIR